MGFFRLSARTANAVGRNLSVAYLGAGYLMELCSIPRQRLPPLHSDKKLSFLTSRRARLSASTAVAVGTQPVGCFSGGYLCEGSALNLPQETEFLDFPSFACRRGPLSRWGRNLSVAFLGAIFFTGLRPVPHKGYSLAQCNVNIALGHRSRQHMRSLISSLQSIINALLYG